MFVECSLYTKHFPYILSFNFYPQPDEMGTTISPIYQTEKWKLGGVKLLTLKYKVMDPGFEPRECDF